MSVRNITTGYIFPQFHVVYDNEFQTVIGGYDDNETLAPNIWKTLCTNSKENAAEDMTSNDSRLPRLHKDWLLHEEKEDREHGDLNSTGQNRVRHQLKLQEQCKGRVVTDLNKESND